MQRRGDLLVKVSLLDEVANLLFDKGPTEKEVLMFNDIKKATTAGALLINSITMLIAVATLALMVVL
ncbi:hypothetical protein AL705_04080 [Lawsonella clevelandensis]|uniref:Uncharacterized protein n=2 Tax=Lawsonella clevelandensis TaxID=1528099 RepID=A0A0M4MXL0_9ACTN|nr:hypothetical protein AL705_04080 [Lawsonella clevelandensis]